MKFADVKPTGKLPAFTLIELLIVVLIIAILAAIAVPNFLEFQTRAKVSRVAVDLRTLSIAVEAYFVDHDTYIHDQDNCRNPGCANSEQSFRDLSSPISYLTNASRIRDPFAQFEDTANPDDVAPFYQAATGVDPWRRPATLTARPIQAYCLFSYGPDLLHQMINDDWPYSTNTIFYDPTNGTVSVGEVLRFGGNYRSGAWTINGILWETWGGLVATYP